MRINKLRTFVVVAIVCYLFLFFEWIVLPSKVIYYLSVLIFVLCNFFYLKKEKSDNYFCFELLFALSYFAACLLYPFLLDRIAKKTGYMTMIFDSTLEIEQLRFFILSLVAYYSYMFALTVDRKKKILCLNNIQIPRKLISISNIIMVIGIIVFLICGGFQILYRYSGKLGAFSQYGGVLFYVTIFFTISTMLNFLGLNKKNITSLRSLYFSLRPLYKYSSIFFIGLMTISGYRSQTLQLCFPIILMYSIVVRPIGVFRLLLYMGIGICMMILIGFTRIGESVGSNAFDIIDCFRDYLIEGAAGVWLLHYTDIYGPTWGTNAILQIFSVIPFVQSLLVSILGPQFFTDSSSIMFTLAFRDDGSGLGTNVVGDIYFTFGLIGTLVCMYFLGVVVKKVSYPRNLYQLLLLLLLLGNSVFSTRVEFFYLFRTLGFSLIILFVLMKLLRIERYAYFDD